MIFKVLKHFFGIIGVLLICSSSVVAQDGGGGVGKKVAAGTVVAAALESIGYQAQSQVLMQLKETMQEIGGLVYLGVILSVLITAGLMGSYAPVLWLLIGPPLFVYVSGVEIGGQSNRINSSGPDWKFGAFKDNDGFKKKVMKRSDEAVPVSFVFHKYNEIISEIYQELIKVITSEDTTVSMLFMARQRVFEDLFGMEIRDGKALELSGTFLTQCSYEMTLARYIAAAAEKPEIASGISYETYKEEYCRRMPLVNKEIRSKSLEEQLATLDPPHMIGNNVSCTDLWIWLRQLVVKDIASQTEASLMNAYGPEAKAAANGASQLYSRTIQDALKKIVTRREDRKGISDVCADAGGGEQSEGIDSQGDDFTVLANIMAGLMIRKQQVRKDSTNFEKILGGDHSGIIAMDNAAVGGVRVSVSGSESQLRRIKAQEMAATRKYETFTFLMILPYFQGALLYGLAFLYPFFALLVLVPGKADGFLGWMALWAWVKSWDVGWAIVMVTDQILWDIMPHTTFYDLGDSGGYTPVNLMEMHYAGDYAYSLALYWTIVAALVTSVPILSAEFILGAKKGLSTVLLSGATDFSERISSAAGNYVASQSIGRGQEHRQQQEGMAMAGNLGNTARGSAQNIQGGVDQTMGSNSPVQALDPLKGVGSGGAPDSKSSEQQANREAANNSPKKDNN